MIKIFNRKLEAEILIDEHSSWIQFNTRDYEDKPYVIIELKEFSFPQHAYKCEDCGKFLSAFGKDSLDWYISYSNKVFRLDTSKIGGIEYPSNEIKVTMSDYDPGTKMTLVFHELPTEVAKLQNLLKEAVEVENYTKACVLRDLIKE
jgi:hypothetical protein